MPRFSANLGFLWAELTLPQAIRAAGRAGFDAVECHWPYDVAAAEVAAALRETGLPMLGLNTVRGDSGGLSAISGREDAARAAIDQAVDYAVAVGARNVHVMAGIAQGPAAAAAFDAALHHACARAAPHGIGILIEPLNHHDAPGYFLRTSDQAAAIIERLALPGLKMLFDCYHIQIMEGDVTRRLTRHLPHVGHVQIAAVPDRGEPDAGELHYPHIYRHLDAIGWTAPLGAEYRPRAGDTDAGLAWLDAARAPRPAEPARTRFVERRREIPMTDDPETGRPRTGNATSGDPTTGPGTTSDPNQANRTDLPADQTDETGAPGGPAAHCRPARPNDDPATGPGTTSDPNQANRT